MVTIPFHWINVMGDKPGDKLVITYSFKEGTKTITFGDLKEAENKGMGGSDLDSVGAGRLDGFRGMCRITRGVSTI